MKQSLCDTLIVNSDLGKHKVLAVAGYYSESNNAFPYEGNVINLAFQQ